MMARRAHFAGEPLQDGKVFLVGGEWIHPSGKVVRIQVELKGFLALFLLEGFLIQAGWHHDAGPKTVAPVHENETHGRLARLGSPG